MASRKIEDLHPLLQLKYWEFFKACAAVGIDVLTYCCFRSCDEQLELYEWGRTKVNPNTGPLKGKPFGAVVTWTTRSAHNHRLNPTGMTPASLAFDCVPMVAGKPVWGNTLAYAKMGEIGENLGLIWGGHFHGGKRDMPHFELKLPA